MHLRIRPAAQGRQKLCGARKSPIYPLKSLVQPREATEARSATDEKLHGVLAWRPEGLAAPYPGVSRRASGAPFSVAHEPAPGQARGGLRDDSHVGLGSGWGCRHNSREQSQAVFRHVQASKHATTCKRPSWVAPVKRIQRCTEPVLRYGRTYLGAAGAWRRSTRRARTAPPASSSGSSTTWTAPIEGDGVDAGAMPQ